MWTQPFHILHVACLILTHDSSSEQQEFVVILLLSALWILIEVFWSLVLCAGLAFVMPLCSWSGIKRESKMCNRQYVMFGLLRSRDYDVITWLNNCLFPHLVYWSLNKNLCNDTCLCQSFFLFTSIRLKIG